MSNDGDYVSHKKSDRVYFSKEFQVKRAGGTHGARYVSRVIEAGEHDSFVRVEKEHGGDVLALLAFCVWCWGLAAC